MSRFLIMLEQTESGFAVQAPDLAIVTHGETIEAAKRAACEAIQVNLAAYEAAGLAVPPTQSAFHNLENPDYKDLLFAYLEIAAPPGRIAA